MNDWLERSICILWSLGILANALVVRKLVQAWAFPAVLFSLFWFLYTFVPLVSFPEIYVRPVAVFYIFVATVCFSLGATRVNWRQNYAESALVKKNYVDYFRTPYLLYAFWIGFIITMAAMLVNMSIQGVSLDRLTENFTEVASDYAERRYASDLSENIFRSVANVLTYFCAALGGIIVTSQKGVQKWLVIIASILPSIFTMMTQSAKGMLFLCLAVFYAGVLVGRLQQGHTSLLPKRAIPGLIVSAGVLVLLVTVSFLSRGLWEGGLASNTSDAIWSLWASYSSGHLFAFSDWFGHYLGYSSIEFYDDPPISFGFFTFMAVFQALGDNRYVPLGIYDEYVIIPPYITTNIYTMFRGLIYDFGLLGSLIALMFFSFLIHFAFSALLKATRPAFLAAIFIFSVGFIYQSFIVSSLSWLSLPAGLLLVSLTIAAAKFRDHVPAAELTVA